MQLLVLLLCCVAVAVRGAPSRHWDFVSRKITQTQVQLKDFHTPAGKQGDGSAPIHSLLIIKPGCCVAALACFHDNLLNVTAQRPRDDTLLFSSLKSTLMADGVRCRDPGPAPAPTCPACDSFPRTKAELVDQLTLFLQRAQSSLSANGPSTRS